MTGRNILVSCDRPCTSAIRSTSRDQDITLSQEITNRIHNMRQIPSFLDTVRKQARDDKSKSFQMKVIMEMRCVILTSRVNPLPKETSRQPCRQCTADSLSLILPNTPVYMAQYQKERKSQTSFYSHMTVYPFVRNILLRAPVIRNMKR